MAQKIESNSSRARNNDKALNPTQRAALFGVAIASAVTSLFLAALNNDQYDEQVIDYQNNIQDLEEKIQTQEEFIDVSVNAGATNEVVYALESEKMKAQANLVAEKDEEPKRDNDLEVLAAIYFIPAAATYGALKIHRSYSGHRNSNN